MALSGQQPVKEFDHYLKDLISGLNLGSREKSELEEEFRQHLLDHYQALLQKNVEKEVAVRTVLEQFGGIEMLQAEVNQTYPGSVRNAIIKELLIAALCLLACLIGPWLLIGAIFQSYFIYAPILFLMLAAGVYHLLVKHQTYWLFSLAGTAAIYSFFLYLFLPQMGGVFTPELYAQQLFTLDWNRLTGPSGLFNLVTLHMLWYVLILVQLVLANNYIPVWKQVCNAGFQYWAMLLAGVFLARWQPSAETSVLLANVFLLYAFFQQTLSPEGFIRLKKKIGRLLMRQDLS